MKVCRICTGTHQHLYAEGDRFVHAECLPPKPHWTNPWKDVVYVPIEELAECHAGIGKSYGDVDGTSHILTKERVLAHWQQGSEKLEDGSYKLDAYILPQPSGWHSIGIRYGEDGPEYLSPMGDRDKVIALLNKYRKVG